MGNCINCRYSCRCFSCRLSEYPDYQILYTQKIPINKENRRFNMSIANTCHNELDLMLNPIGKDGHMTIISEKGQIAYCFLYNELLNVWKRSEKLYEWIDGPIYSLPVYKLPYYGSWVDASCLHLIQVYNTFVLKQLKTCKIGSFSPFEHSRFHGRLEVIYTLEPIHYNTYINFMSSKNLQGVFEPKFFHPLLSDLNPYFIAPNLDNISESQIMEQRTKLIDSPELQVDGTVKNMKIQIITQEGGIIDYIGDVKNGRKHGNGIEIQNYIRREGIWSNNIFISGWIYRNGFL